MFYSFVRGRLPHALNTANTKNEQQMARLVGYLGALR